MDDSIELTAYSLNRYSLVQPAWGLTRSRGDTADDVTSQKMRVGAIEIEIAIGIVIGR